jgi:hypothetical protein
MPTIGIGLRGKSYHATEDQIFDAISRGIDEVLGKKSSFLIFKTAKLVYHTDYSRSLPHRVDSFQEFLQKAFGEKVCSAIMDSTASHMQKYCINT